MKRNFLLMLLLTLLPFTAWAQYLEFDEATYDGTSHAFPQVYLDQFHYQPIPADGTYATYSGWRYRVNHWRKSGSTTDLTQYQNAGSYVANVQRRYGSSGQWQDWEELTLTVNKATITPTLTPNAAVYNGEQNDLPGVQVGGSTVFDGLDDGFDGTWKVEWKAGSSSVSSWKNKGTYTVTVSNTNQEGTANFVVGKGTNYFTTEPTMEGWTFDPTCYDAPKAEPTGAAAKWGTVEFEYSNDNSTWTDYATAVGGMANTTGTPKYYVRAFVEEDADGNYDRKESTVQEFVISKATFSKEGWDAIFTNPTANSGLEWDGTSKALITEGVVKDSKAFTGATISYAYSPDGGTSWSGGYKATPAGPYQVKYTIAGARNFNDYVSNDNVIAASIAQATNSVTDPTVADITYGATPTPDGSVAKQGGSTLKYVYQKVGSEDPYTDAIAKFTAGDWNVKAVVAETNNYAGAESNPVTFNVAKAQFTVNSTLAAKSGMIYSAGEQSLLTGTIKKTTGMPDGIVTYTIGEETFGPIHSSDPSLVKKTNAGEYEVNWSVTAQDEEEAKNWLPATGKITAKIAQADVILAGKAVVERNYGVEITSLAEIIFSSGWPTAVKDDEAKQIAVINDGFTVTGTPEKKYPDAGNYNIVLTPKDESAMSDDLAKNYNFTLANPTVVMKVNPVDATLTAVAKEKTYGSADPEFEATATGLVAGDDLTKIGLSFTREEGNNVGKYAITPASTSENYNWTIVTANLTINPKGAKVKADDKEKEFGAEDPVFTATFTDLIETDKGKVKATFTREDGEDVGTYEITPAVTKDAVSDNYSFTVETGTLKIGAVMASATAPTPKDLVYKDNGELQELVNAATNVVGGTVWYSLDGGEWTTSIPKANAYKEGGYEIAWKVKPDANHTEYAPTETVKAAIAKAPVTDIDAPEPVQLLIFNGKAQTLVTAAKFADGIEKGTFKYSLDNATWADKLPEGLNAGEYTVYTQFAPDANHNDQIVASVDASIAKMELGYTLTTISNLTYTGKEVKDVDSKAYMLTKPNVLPGKDALEAPFKFEWPETVKDAKDYDFIELKVVWANTDDPDFAENYTFKFTGHANFTIEPKELTEGMITVNPKSAPFTGDNVPAVTVAVADGDALVFGNKDAAKNDVNYTITKDGATFENGKFSAAGTYNFTFTAQNNYKGEVVVPFTVNGMSIANMLQMLDNTNWNAVTYNGKNQAPKFKLSYKKVVDGKEKEITPDYNLEISYMNGDKKVVVSQDQVVDAHDYTFKFTGKGNYSGEIVKVKKINAKALKATDFAVTEKVEYTSKDQMPSIVAKSEIENLKEGKDYKVLLNGAEITKDTKLPNFAATYVFSFVGQGNYNNTINKNFVITPATVLITAGSYEKFYDGQVGLANSELVEGDVAWTYSGLKDGDNITDNDVVVAAGALNVQGASKNAGTYNLKVDASKFSVSDNYTFVAADTQGTLTIKKAPVTLGFKNVQDKKPFYSVTKVYGEADSRDAILSKVIALENKEESPISSELVGLANTIVNSKTGLKAMNFHRTNAGVEEVGKYNEVVEIEFNEGVFGNYAVTTSAGNFEITEAPLTVALKNDIEFVYNGAYPAEELANIDASQLAISGMQSGDDYNVLKNVKGIVVDDKGNTIEPKNVGTYIVKLTAEADNYDVKVLDSRLIITPATLTVTIADQTVNKGAKDDALNMSAATVKGIVGSDDIKATMKLNASTTAAGKFDDGVKFTIANPNYEIVEEDEVVEAVYGKLIVIDPAAVDIALDDSKAFTLPKNNTTADVTFTTRTVNANTWNVCVLPFETTPAEISMAFGYAAVDVLNTEAMDGNIHFQIITSGKIPAGTPFIFKPSEDADGAVTDFDEVTFEQVTVVKSLANAAAGVYVDLGNSYQMDKSGNKFWGTFKETSFYGKEYWYMSKGDWKDARNFTDAKPCKVKPFRAYVEFATPAGGRIFIEEPDGTETAIDAIQFNQMANGEGIYTIDGKKVNAVNQKGIYIKDGKKVAVK